MLEGGDLSVVVTMNDANAIVNLDSKLMLHIRNNCAFQNVGIWTKLRSSCLILEISISPRFGQTHTSGYPSSQRSNQSSSEVTIAPTDSRKYVCEKKLTCPRVMLSYDWPTFPKARLRLCTLVSLMTSLTRQPDQLPVCISDQCNTALNTVFGGQKYISSLGRASVVNNSRRY